MGTLADGRNQTRAPGVSIVLWRVCAGRFTQLKEGTMADHPNAGAFRKGYAAFQTGDLDTVRALFAPDMVWNLSGKNRFSGVHRGVDNVLALLLQQLQETDGTFKVEVHDILANDEHAVALATVSGTRDGKTLAGTR
jgi:uncharacterized protein